jgi:hypothetical protein
VLTFEFGWRENSGGGDGREIFPLEGVAMPRVDRILCTLVSVVGFGWWGQADTAAAQSPKLYSGSLSLHYFGNDTTTGAKSPFNARVFVALPLGARCNPAMSGGAACNPSATLQVGAPLTGGGPAVVGSGTPASIMLPASQLARITAGSLPPRYASQIYQKTYANLVNAAGSFRPGGGPGSVGYQYRPDTGIKIFQGKNQFGGVMRLLKGTPSGGLGTTVRYSEKGKGYMGYFPTWGVTQFGWLSLLPYQYPQTITGTFHSTIGSAVSTVTAAVRGWPWTTGMVSVYASGDYNPNTSGFPERLVRTGYDNRSPNGDGTIQLVTPHLTSWGALPSVQMGAIGVLRLQFAPEPRSVLVLLAGAGLLGVLYRWRTR